MKSSEIYSIQHWNNLKGWENTKLFFSLDSVYAESKRLRKQKGVCFRIINSLTGFIVEEFEKN